MGDQVLVTEIPSSLKQLARIVVRGFYTIEDALIVDMLVRNPCKLKRKQKQTKNDNRSPPQIVSEWCRLNMALTMTGIISTNAISLFF